MKSSMRWNLVRSRSGRGLFPSKSWIFKIVSIILSFALTLILASCPPPVTETLETAIKDVFAPRITIDNHADNEVFHSKIVLRGTVSDDAFALGDEKGTLTALSVWAGPDSLYNGGILIDPDGNTTPDESKGKAVVGYNRSTRTFTITIEGTDKLGETVTVKITAVDLNGKTTVEELRLQKGVDTTMPMSDEAPVEASSDSSPPKTVDAQDTDPEEEPELKVANIVNKHGDIATTPFSINTGVTIDNTPPEITFEKAYVGTDENTKTAGSGKTINVIFTLDEPQKSGENPKVTLKIGNSAGFVPTNLTTTNRKEWTATYQVKSSDPEGRLHLEVITKDEHGNTSETFTTDTGVEIETTAPKITFEKAYVGTDENKKRAGIGNTINVIFTLDEPQKSGENPKVTLKIGNGAEFVPTNLTTTNRKEWTATYQVKSGDSEGVLKLEVTAKDTHDNTATTSSPIDTGITTIDKTLQTITLENAYVGIGESNEKIARRFDIFTVIFILSTEHNALEDPKVIFQIGDRQMQLIPSVHNSNHDGMRWEATCEVPAMQGLVSEGVLEMKVTAKDKDGETTTVVLDTGISIKLQ